MDLTHEVSFVLDLEMPPEPARAFVRDVPRSLSQATFLADLQVIHGDPDIVTATLPVNAALFGQRELPFRSELTVTDDGARLTGLPITPTGPGWAEVSGDARVTPSGDGCRVAYAFRIAIHLALPAPEKWGGRALLSMIEFTARNVLQGVMASFPEAVRAAAREVEAAWV
ncbi:MAG TPA: DUF3809 domain-containing protein [Trueperaceae bacterium]|nr:DUF3809 domain-containing protein [Trueperaceae bacterium]